MTTATARSSIGKSTTVIPNALGVAFWFHRDEAEALRRTAYEQRLKESEIVRRAVRAYLGIED